MRGGHVLLIGIACIVISVFTGLAIFHSAMSAGGVRGLQGQMTELTFFSAIANLFFYGGIIAVVVGVVLMVIQSQQLRQSPSSTGTGSSRESALEEENRQLREKLSD